MIGTQFTIKWINKPRKTESENKVIDRNENTKKVKENISEKCDFSTQWQHTHPKFQ